MLYKCDKRKARFIDENWRFICRVISLYCGLSAWAVLSVSEGNPYIGLSIATLFVFFMYTVCYEIQQANCYTALGGCYRRVAENFDSRTIDTDIEVLEKRLRRGQFIALLIPFVAGVALIFPKAAYMVSFFVGLLASRLGEYYFEEQLQAPKAQKMSVTTCLSIALFVTFLGLAWRLDVLGLQYSATNRAMHYYMASLGSWFAIGFIGQLVISFIEKSVAKEK